jgi:formylglycine-generating enzyme required for sulfatase activity
VRFGWLNLVPVIALLIIPVGAARAEKGDRVALIIANSNYEHGNSLKNPSADAALVEAALKKAGFQSISMNADVGNGAMRDALRRFSLAATRAEVALVYYAGHGVKAEDTDWLIPVDATLQASNDLEFEAVDMNLVLRSVSGAKFKIVILDACRDNPFTRGWTANDRGSPQGLGETRTDGVLMIFSAAPGQLALDGDGENSPFAQAVANWIPAPGLEIHVLGSKIRDDVLKSTQGRQQPYVNASISGDLFTFVDGSPVDRGSGAGGVNTSTGHEGVTPPAPPAAPEVKAIRDCPDICPDLVLVPAGAFMMGSDEAETGRGSDEGPRHKVSIPAFAAARGPVTVGQFSKFVAETGRDLGNSCFTADGPNAQIAQRTDRSWKTPDFPQGEDHPVVCVSWDDAKAYAAWLSKKTGKSYRLLSEAEYEYTARAGSDSIYWWGDQASSACDYANGEDLDFKAQYPSWVVTECHDGFVYTSPVGHYRVNKFGLYDMIGNAWSWTEDCYVDSYAGTPTDGAANPSGTCAARVIRGGSWMVSSRMLRSAKRADVKPQTRSSVIGFRVARSP